MMGHVKTGILLETQKEKDKERRDDLNMLHWMRYRERERESFPPFKVRPKTIYFRSQRRKPHLWNPYLSSGKLRICSEITSSVDPSPQAPSSDFQFLQSVYCDHM